jgi:hypothetical protein
VAHLELVHDDVDRPVAFRIDEVALAAAEQRVVPLVRRVALGLEEREKRRSILRPGREVEIDLPATGSGGPLASPPGVPSGAVSRTTRPRVGEV